MIIKILLQFFFITFIFIIPPSIVILVIYDLHDFINEINEINKIQ